MDFKIYENFIYNKARDLEVSLFNHFFLNDEIDNCLLSLSLYINEDGGVSNINPDNLNNTSTLCSCIYFLDILFKLKYENQFEYFNEIIEEIISYLIKQNKFSYFHETNINKPCSNLFKVDNYFYELEAITYAYIMHYSNNDYNTKLNELINIYLSNENPSIQEVYYFKIIEQLFNNDLLKTKIINDTKLLLNDNDLYKLIFSSDDYLINIYLNEFNSYKELLDNNKNSIGIWDRVNDWDSMYPEAEVADIKYLSITLIDILLFMKYIGV